MVVVVVVVLIGNSNVGGVVINRRSVKNFFEALIQKIF